VRIVANINTGVCDGSDGSTNTDTLAFHLSGSTNSDNSMSWKCLPGDNDKDNPIPLKYLPANCRG